MGMIAHTMSNRRSSRASSTANNSKKKQASSPKGGKPEGGGLFPAKLHNLLDYAEEHGFHDTISWTDEGSSFEIHDTNKIVELLPLFFGQTKYRSFYRQMNMWSFERIQDDTGVIKFRHPLFRKGKREISQDMCREIFQQTNPTYMKRTAASTTASPSRNTGVAAGTTSGKAILSRAVKSVDRSIDGDGKVKSKRTLKRALSDQTSSLATIKKNSDAVIATTHPNNKRRHSDRSVSSDSKLLLRQMSGGPLSGPLSSLRSSSDSSLRGASSFGETFTSIDDAIDQPIDDDIFNDDTTIKEGDLMEFAGRPFYFVDWDKEDTSTSKSLIESIHSAPSSQLPSLHRKVPSTTSPDTRQIPMPLPSPTPLPTPAIDVSADGMVTNGLLSSSLAANAKLPLPLPITSRSTEPIEQRLQSLYAFVNQGSNNNRSIGDINTGNHNVSQVHQGLSNKNSHNSESLYGGVTSSSQQQQQQQQQGQLPQWPMDR